MDTNFGIFGLMYSVAFSSFEQKFSLGCSQPAEVIVTNMSTLAVNFPLQ